MFPMLRVETKYTGMKSILARTEKKATVEPTETGRGPLTHWTPASSSLAGPSGHMWLWLWLGLRHGGNRERTGFCVCGLKLARISAQW